MYVVIVSTKHGFYFSLPVCCKRDFFDVLFSYMRTIHVEFEPRLTAFHGNSTLETASEGS